MSVAERRARRAEVDDPEVALAAALRFIEVRSRSVEEVRRRLTRAGYPSALVDGAVRRLSELGVLDDEAFARSWLESRDRARPRGEAVLRRELLAKGIDRTLVDELLAERGEGSGRDVDLAAAERLLASRARSLERAADPRVRRQRAYALLARNGFDPETCSQAVATWVGAHE
jgi:regulatory protein